MSRNVQNWGLATPTPMGKGLSGSFTKKLFWWEVHEMSKSAHAKWHANILIELLVKLYFNYTQAHFTYSIFIVMDILCNS